MKVVILAGGLGTRLSEETDLKPKPMVEIGGKPILWHIMKIYSHYGFNDFIICLGYKGYLIKEYFSNYFLHQSDLTIDFENNSIKHHNSKAEPWKVTLVDTGINTMTGGRLKKVSSYLDNETFMMTYGDGVADVNINEIISSHNKNNKLVTLTAVQPSGRFGAIDIDEKGLIKTFKEKPKGDGSWINGGFFVCEPKALDYIENDDTFWEADSLEKLALHKELSAFKHNGFWRPMDTLRDKRELDDLWNNNKAPWKIWK